MPLIPAGQNRLDSFPTVLSLVPMRGTIEELQEEPGRNDPADEVFIQLK
ncbi:MAG: hypothetical protein ABI162_05785 [Luteolibacter sp.]